MAADRQQAIGNKQQQQQQQQQKAFSPLANAAEWQTQHLVASQRRHRQA